MTDPFSGRSYVYAATPAGFLLYSVGASGRNDGTNPNRELTWKLEL